MCGIAGIVFRDGLRPVEPSDLAAMAAPMQHRGPDDEGTLIDGAVGLVARRLSVIDLPGGHQPIWNEDHTIAAIQNGEIYNYRTLRSELSRDGHVFLTASDTEVLAHLYEKTGPDAALPARLHGMYAFAVYDAKRQIILLARDRAGEKPMYLYCDPVMIAFASTLTALFAPRLPMDRSLDPAAIRGYLQVQHISGPATIFTRARQLAPASLRLLERTGRGWQEHVGHRYWALTGEPHAGAARDDSFAAAIDDTERLLVTAVRDRLQSDVPLGAFLSGGVDSSLVAAIMAQERPGRVQTYSIGFDDPAMDESSAAGDIARRLGTRHRQLVMPTPGADQILEILRQCDQPLADPALVPSWYLSRMVHEEVTVALSGEGADEVFGGYRWYRRHGWRPSGEVDPREARYTLRRDQEPAWMRWALLSDAMKEASAAEESHRTRLAYAAAWADSAGAAPIARLQWVDFATWMPDDLLVKVDRMSMAHSLEVRCPYLDHRLVERVIGGPDRWKIRWGHRKALLRAVARRYLPHAVALRKKHGFQVPIDALMRTTLRDLVAELTSPERVREHGVFDPQGVLRLVGRWQSDPSLARALWKVLCLEGWLYACHLSGMPGPRPAAHSDDIGRDAAFCEG